MLQMTIANHIKIFGSAPDFMLMCVIFFGLFLGGGAGLESGLAAGALKDIFSLDYFGINMFVFGLVGFIVGILNTKFFKDSKATQFILVFVFTSFSMLLHFVLVSVFSKYLILGFGEYFFSSILLTSIYTSLISILVFSKLAGFYDLRETEDFI